MEVMEWVEIAIVAGASSVSTIGAIIFGVTGKLLNKKSGGPAEKLGYDFGRWISVSARLKFGKKSEVVESFVQERLKEAFRGLNRGLDSDD